MLFSVPLGKSTERCPAIAGSFVTSYLPSRAEVFGADQIVDGREKLRGAGGLSR